MFIPRKLSSHLSALMEWFPVVSVTGPRQSGKSTLLREMLPDVRYLNLEDPGIRQQIQEDSLGVLRSLGTPLIIDEAQHVPELFSAVQIISDERGTPGQYVLSGSQNFLLMESITQTLAGRLGISHLLPLGFSEAGAEPQDFQLQGGYPRLRTTGMPSEIFFDNYIRTYIERDVTGLLGIRNATAFRKFLKAVSFQAGSLVNYSNLANELGIAFQTAKDWMSILESSFVIFTLPAYQTNRRKSLTKTPKIFFYDTGLLCHLLGIRSTEDLALCPHKGAVFENFIVAETAKHHIHSGRTPEMYFYRDSSKREIDLLDFTTQSPTAIEIKSSYSYQSKFTRHLVPISELLDIAPERRLVVYLGTESLDLEQFRTVNAGEYLLQLP